MTPLGNELASWTELQRPEPIARQVYRKLRQSIVSRRLPAGERLREVDLAKALGVSRTPVREAIARLVSERLVRPMPGGGVEVVDTRHELAEIYHIRKALEGYAARLAAESITAAELAALEDLLQESARAGFDGSFERRARLNEEFHSAIARAACVPRLIEMVQEFRDYSTTARVLERSDRESARRGFEGHVEVLRCLRERDPARAEAAMRQHLDEAYRLTVSGPDASA